MSVNPGLTAKRRPEPNTTKHPPERYAAFARRIVAALGKRVADDLDQVHVLVELQEQLEAHLRTAIGAARDDGYSWTDIADRLGVTRQAAHKRFGGPR